MYNAASDRSSLPIMLQVPDFPDCGSSCKLVTSEVPTRFLFGSGWFDTQAHPLLQHLLVRIGST